VIEQYVAGYKVAQVSSFCGGANVLVPQLSRPMTFVAVITWRTAAPNVVCTVKLCKIGRRFAFAGMFVGILGIEDEEKGERNKAETMNHLI
jgi:hypothetical protein